MTNNDASNRSKVKHLGRPLQVFRAQLVLFWETAWPALLPILAPLAILIIMSLFGVWRAIPVIAHWLILITSLCATIWAITRFGKEMRWPDHRTALHRLETDGTLDHTPLQALEDHQFAPTDNNDAADQLWAAHQKKMAQASKGAKLRGTFATADKRDRFALRYLISGLLMAGFIIAGPQSFERLQTMLSPGTSHLIKATKADMWIEPPAYSGLAPIYLVQGDDNLPDVADQVDVPVGSTLIAQINGERGARLDYIDTDGNVTPATQPNDDEDTSDTRARRAKRLELTLIKNGLIDLSLGQKRGRWPVLVLGDKAPLVSFMSPPEEDKNRALKLHYIFEDDYGAVETHFSYRLNPDQRRPLDAPLLEDVALEVTRAVLLEGTDGPSGERRVNLPIESDPWAGLDVLARIIVTDGAGQTGNSLEVNVTLPSRPFFNPLAKAVIEQRQSLSVAPDEVQRVRDSFNALTVLPEEFFEDTSEYLLMRTAFWRVQRNRETAEPEQQFGDVDPQQIDLEERSPHESTINHFWPLALELEDKALELARRRLEAAFEALREALEQNAPQDEIDKRHGALEQAIQDYLQALAQAGVQEQGGGAGSEQIGANTIQEMLDGIEDLSENGANNGARQLLGDLESLLENLRLTQGGQGSSGIPNPGEGSPSDGPSAQAGELIGRQRELSDDAFERSQEDGADADDLSQEQGDIAQALEELLESLQNGQQQGGQQQGQQQGGQQQGGQQGQGQQQGQQPGQAGRPSPSSSGTGSDPNGNAAQALGEALREMQQSEQALGNGNFDQAGSAMNRAISKLREGAQSLAEEQARQQAENGEGENGEGNQSGDAGNDARDPLGRPTGGTAGGNIDVPDGADPALTRDLIEKMRERLGEQGRSEEEIDYLERLLEAF